MRTSRVLPAVLAGCIGVVSVAQGSEQVGQWYGTVMGTYMNPDNDRNLKDGLRGGQLGVGRAFSDHINAELDLDYFDAKGDGGPDTSFTGISANGMYLWNREGSFTQYILGGIGALKTDPDGFGSQTRTQLQAGPGFLYDLGSDRLSLRAEVLGRWADGSPDSSTDLLVNVGVQFAFGSTGSKKAAAATTAAVATAAVVATAPADDDNDGVSNAQDNCPGTPAGTAVDAQGCELDGDKDGVPDSKDLCPESSMGAAVNAKGCLVQLQLDSATFASGSAQLSAEGRKNLGTAVAPLNQVPASVVLIEGYTDSSGSAELNQKLSEQRAAAAKDFLVSQGIAASRITTVGRGESDPIASNDTAEGKAANRRVVLRVTDE
jgi:OOP family OmpA-OmpF porin